MFSALRRTCMRPHFMLRPVTGVDTETWFKNVAGRKFVPDNPSTCTSENTDTCIETWTTTTPNQQSTADCRGQYADDKGDTVKAVTTNCRNIFCIRNVCKNNPNQNFTKIAKAMTTSISTTMAICGMFPAGQG